MALPKWVTKIEERMPPLQMILNIGRRVEMIPEYVRFLLSRNKRRNGFNDPLFQKIKKLKEKYVGERCFIIATGPSLTFDDLLLLKNEYTFGMNSICRIYDKIDWLPTFYGIQDKLVFEKMLDCVFDQDSKVIMFLSDTLRNVAEIPERCVLFPYNVGYHYCNFRRFKHYTAEFSDDCYDTVYDGYTITYSLIQIAVYLGFTEIYLLGADCDYSTPITHFVESGYVDKKAYSNYERMIVGYKKAKEYADENGIKIVNCTRRGKLEVFPRMTLEDVLKENK